MKRWKKLLTCVLAIALVLSCVPLYGLEVEAASADGAKIAAAAQSYMGKEQSVGHCLGFCRVVYRKAGYNTAQDPNGCSSACAYHSWTVSKHLGNTSKNNIPLGALVFFSGASSQSVSSCGARPGHVGIYVGDGYIINARGTVKNGTNISKDKISLWESWGYTFLGWRPISGYTLDSGGSAGNSPTGVLDYAEGKTNAVKIKGWAFDLDDISRNLEIHVYIGGPAGSGEGHKILANAYRNDVNNVYGVGNYHGFDAEISTSLLGNQKVYVYAINIGTGNNQLIGTQTVNISKPNSPQGCVDRIQGGKGFVTVRGWGFDLDDVSKPIEIHVYLTDLKGRVEGHAFVADVHREDVNNIYGVGANHGYWQDISTSLYGDVRVEIYAINIGSGNNVLIASKTVTIDCKHSFTNYISDNNAQIGADGTKTAYCDYGCGMVDTVVDKGSALETKQPEKKPTSKITCKKTVYKVAYGAKPFKIDASSKSKLTFTSSKPKIAAVDKKTGKVTVKNTGIATITIKAGETTKKVTVKVSPKKPTVKSAKTAKGKKLSVKWNKDQKASGYQVQVSTDKEFKKNVKSKKLSKTSYTFTKLKTGKKYYVRMRSYKKSGKETLYSAWSKTKVSGKIKK